MTDDIRGDAPDTGDLLDRARAGDDRALNELFERHVPSLRRWASGRLPHWARDIADTTDIVHDTIIETLKHLDKFENRGDGALGGYLRHALMNRIRNEFRKRAARGMPTTLDSGIPDAATSPLSAAIANETLEKYERGLTRLTPDEREAVLCRLEFGLSYAEIAEVLGKPTANAARMYVVRALARLADEMRNPG